MIDRGRNMYEVDVMAPEDVFLRHTILEGELVWKQPEDPSARQMLFLVFDCILDKGMSMVGCPFSDRHSHALALSLLEDPETMDDHGAA